MIPRPSDRPRSLGAPPSSNAGHVVALMCLAIVVCAGPIVLTQAKVSPQAKPPASTAKKALANAKSLAAGKAIFENQASLCVTCHRVDLGGVVGPDLTDDFWLHGCSATDVMKSIRQGYPVQGMMPFGGGAPLSEADLHRLASYVLSRRGSAPPRPKARDASRDKPCR